MTASITQLTDSLFRHESGKVVSLLVKTLGVEHIQLAEDVVQEALARALKTWPYYGVPENPAAWITQTAKNLALDAVRRDQVFRRKQVDMFGSVHRWSGKVGDEDFADFGREVEDAVLRLMFVCCHPIVPENSQPVLALKTICGFGVPEIAHALFLTDAAVNKRLTRAKEKLNEGEVSADLPVGEKLDERLNGVVKTIYLLFNEGYKANAGDKLVREDLCAEAIRLCSLLSSMPAGDKPRVHALLALMLFNSSRLSARMDSEGHILLLKDQDRSLWDKDMIRRGLVHLSQSAQGDELDTLHLQAAIAAIHCTAPDFASTDWLRILALYDHMLAIDPSPVIALNRAVAVGQVDGPAAGLAAVGQIANRTALEKYAPLHTVLADFEEQLGNHEIARKHLVRALTLTESEREIEFLNSKIESLNNP